MNQMQTNEQVASQEQIVNKYRFLQEKIMLNYKKGCKILMTAKITATILFVLFTLIGVLVSAGNGHQLGWLAGWIILIFLNIIVFATADYAKYLVQSKVVPYLMDDSRIEFGEYDIFKEDDEEEEEEEEEE